MSLYALLIRQLDKATADMAREDAAWGVRSELSLRARLHLRTDGTEYWDRAHPAYPRMTVGQRACEIYEEARR